MLSQGPLRKKHYCRWEATPITEVGPRVLHVPCKDDDNQPTHLHKGTARKAASLGRSAGWKEGLLPRV